MRREDRKVIKNDIAEGISVWDDEQDRLWFVKTTTEELYAISILKANEACVH